MLLFYPQTAPHDLTFLNMTFSIPLGSFYAQAVENIPRTDSWPFILETDSAAPVTITVGSKGSGVVIPTAARMTVMVPTIVAPLVFTIKAENGIDPPVHLLLGQTHIATMLYAMAQQHYEVAGRTVEQYRDAMASPWDSFFAEWLTPWRRELPDPRTLRVLATKAAALSLYGQSGLQGGVTDFVTSCCLTTPVVEDARNPATWQPDLYHPYTSGQDVSGFNFHVWTPDLCQTRWASFLKYCENSPQYDIFRGDEHVVMVQDHGIEQYSQQVFDYTAPYCGATGLLVTAGCMDNLTFTGSMQLTARPAFCAWNEPNPMLVLPPGIGGLFFDSGDLFDTGATFDSVYDLDPLTNYWVGTDLRKTTDGGDCTDAFLGKTHLPENSGCCAPGPDCLVLTTHRTDAAVTSATIPGHPLFGGGTPGVLVNPYFAMLV
jgi:hypothetical protein